MFMIIEQDHIAMSRNGSDKLTAIPVVVEAIELPGSSLSYSAPISFRSNYTLFT